MKCAFVVGAAVALLVMQGVAGRDLPFNRRPQAAGKRQQQLNNPIYLRQGDGAGYQGESQENPRGQDEYYGGNEQPEAQSNDYEAYDQADASPEDGGAQGGIQFGSQGQESEEGGRPGGQGAGQSADDFGGDFVGFDKDSLPGDIPMKFDGPLPELNEGEAEKSQGFIFGAPAGFPSLNDFGGFGKDSNFANDAGQAASDEGAQAGGQDDVGAADYSEDGSTEEFNSPPSKGARGGAGSPLYGGFPQPAGARHYPAGRPQAFVDSAPSPDALTWTK